MPIFDFIKDSYKKRFEEAGEAVDFVGDLINQGKELLTTKKETQNAPSHIDKAATRRSTSLPSISEGGGVSGLRQAPTTNRLLSTSKMNTLGYMEAPPIEQQEEVFKKSENIKIVEQALIPEEKRKVVRPGGRGAEYIQYDRDLTVDEMKSSDVEVHTTYYDPLDPAQTRRNPTGEGSAGIYMDWGYIAVQQSKRNSTMPHGTKVYIPELNKIFEVADVFNKDYDIDGLYKIDFPAQDVETQRLIANNPKMHFRIVD